jgi:GT2 family glycosyltransferase
MSTSHVLSCHVVIINWNGEVDTFECLESLFRYEQNIATTVIDNSNNHSPCCALAGQFREVRFVYNDANIGFASACNQGVRLDGCAGIPYTLFLNNDTVITKSFIGEITAWMDANINVAAVSPVINYHFDPEQPWFSGSMIDEATIDIVHCNHTIPSAPIRVPWLTGCALLVRNDHFNLVGGFDESFFMYSEDVDLSLKFSNAGFDLIIYPIMSVLHKVGQSSKKVSVVSTYYAVRNKIMIIRRYYPTKLMQGVLHILRANLSFVAKSESSVASRLKLLYTIVVAVFQGLTMNKARP